jgi:hypothetical protein
MLQENPNITRLLSEVGASTAHTPGPWIALHEPGHSSAVMIDNGGYRIDAPGDGVEQLAFVWVLNHRVPADGNPQDSGPLFGDVRAGANARLIAAAPDLLEAAMLQEAAEDAHANCEECEGEGVPELCEKCFPLFDNARVKRRLAIVKATGTTDTHRDSVNEQRAENSQ